MTPITDDITWLDATAQAELVRRGEVAPAELVEAAINRIDKINPILNAVIHRRSEAAGVEAAAATHADGPFAGVPFLLKDILAEQAGEPCHGGLRAAKEAGYTPSRDSWLVDRFRRAGFVTVGRTNTPELASIVTTEPLAYGATRNPWDLDRSPGGSSGGAAAAVASSMVPVAHANDVGGSIRLPAHACGLVGFKPGRRPTAALDPDAGDDPVLIFNQHVITRSVRDSAAVLDAVYGTRCRAEVDREPGQLRIGFRTASLGGQPPHAECEAAVANTARLLEALGHHVAPNEFPAFDSPVLPEHIPPVFATVVARDVDRWSARLGRSIGLDELEPLNALLTGLARSLPPGAYAGAVAALQAWSREATAAWETIDVLLTPTSPEPPFELDRIGPLSMDPMATVGELARLAGYTIPFNLTGQPAVSLPLHWTADDLPVGVQLVAAEGREDLLFRLAGQLEQARPWSHHRPPLA